jgi:hypothetical protein
MSFRSTKDTAVLAKVESNYGTAPPMAAGDAIKAMDVTIRTLADTLEQDISRPYFGGNPGVLVGRRIELDFTVDLIGASTPGDSATLAAIYRGCGHSETLVAHDPGPPEVLASATYAPVGMTGQASVTIDFIWAGVRFRMTGARGSMDVEWSIKDHAKAKCKFIGRLIQPIDQEPPGGIDLSAFTTPPALEAPTWSMTIGAYSCAVRQLTLNANAQLPLIEAGGGLNEVVWTERKPGGEILIIKRDLLSTFNPWAIADAQGITLLTSTVTGGAGKNVVTTIRAQLGYPEPTDIEGVAGYKIPYVAIPNAPGNEYSHTFS